jgi:hypothetical protein
MPEPSRAGITTFTPGDRVDVVGAEAQTAAGGSSGTVVGHTKNQADESSSEVVVALDAPATKNAVITPADLAAPRPASD